MYDGSRLNIEKAEQMLDHLHKRQLLMKDLMLADIDSLKRDTIRALWEYEVVKASYACQGCEVEKVSLTPDSLWELCEMVALVCSIREPSQLWDQYCLLSKMVVQCKAMLEKD